MVEASRPFACVYVECAFGRKNREISDRYNVTSFPTVVFCDPDGTALEPLGSREAADVAAQMRRIAATYAVEPDVPAPPAVPAFTPKAFQDAKALSRPLAVYFYDDSPASGSVHAALADALLKPLLQRVVLVKTELRRGSVLGVHYDVSRAPTILVLDPGLGRPEERPLARIVGSRSARELQRELESALLPGAAPPAPAPAGAPPPARQEETDLSDDEVDRRFIQASLLVAREWLRKGAREKAVEILEDILKTYPKQTAAREAGRLLEEIRKRP